MVFVGGQEEGHSGLLPLRFADFGFEGGAIAGDVAGGLFDDFAGVAGREDEVGGGAGGDGLHDIGVALGGRGGSRHDGWSTTIWREVGVVEVVDREEN